MEVKAEAAGAAGEGAERNQPTLVTGTFLAALYVVYLRCTLQVRENE